MEMTLQFITNSAPTAQRKKKKRVKENVKKSIMRFRGEYTPLEIQNMDMPRLEYLYEYGTPYEKELADRVIRSRKQMEIANLLPDDILASGSPTGSSAPIIGVR